MGLYRKKPVTIEAVQWTGSNLSEIQEFYRPDSILVGDEIKISTLEGVMTAAKGDFIVKGVKGEFYPCKPDIFAETNEPAGTCTPDNSPFCMDCGYRYDPARKCLGYNPNAHAPRPAVEAPHA